MQGLRAYDMFVAGHNVLLNLDPLAVSEARKRFEGMRRLTKGLPLFLAQDAAVLFGDSVESNGGRVPCAKLPCVVPPFENFLVEWDRPAITLEVDNASLRLTKMLALCTWHTDSSGFTIFDFSCGYADNGLPAVAAHGLASVRLSDSGDVIGVEMNAGRARGENVHLVKSQDRVVLDSVAAWENGGATYSTGVVLFTLALLSSKNVSRVASHTPRALRRHPGPFSGTVNHSHYTLDIPGAREFRESVEGVGEAQRKRLHIVRGHFADYTEGGGLFGKLHGRYYIAPHVRGSAERGTVTKDYRVLAPA